MGATGRVGVTSFSSFRVVSYFFPEIRRKALVSWSIVPGCWRARQTAYSPPDYPSKLNTVPYNTTPTTRRYYPSIQYTTLRNRTKAEENKKDCCHLPVILQALDDLRSHPVRRPHHARSLVLFRCQRRREPKVGELDLTLQVHLLVHRARENINQPQQGSTPPLSSQNRRELLSSHSRR